MEGLTTRTPKDKIIDRFFTLYVLSKASKRVNSLGRVKLQKIVFLSEWKMISKRMKGLNYNYIKFNHGPYSPELQDDMDRFPKLKQAVASTLMPTENGVSIVDDFANVIDQNRDFFDIVDVYTKACTSVDLDTLLDKVYSLKHPIRKNMTIGETPLKTPILYPLDAGKAEVVFQVSNSDLEDLAMSLDPKIIKKLDSAMDDIHSGRILSHREVFGAV